jgi:hypothetical protein
MQLIKLSITTILLVFAVLTVMADATQLRRTKSEKSSKGSGTKGGHGGRHRRHSTKDCGEPRKPHKHGKYDLGIRFNKFKMTDDYIGFPVKLDWRNFPLDEDMAYKLSHYSTVQSLVMPDDYEVKEVCIEHYIDAVGGYPVFPERDPNSPFWQELQEVVNAQKMRIQGRIPSFFVLPDTWKGYTADQVADAVHNEYPGFNHIFLIESLFAEGLEIDHTCTPFRSKYDFIGEQVRLSTLNTWSVGVVSAVNFAVKFYVGQPRPEEIAWMIYRGELTAADGVPQTLMNDIKSMTLTNSTSFTAYPEGCPTHPSWPAMHSAASSASLWLAVVANLTEEQYCQVLRTDYAVAYARTVAGVHYPMDNIGGLNLGQEVIADRLADHLAYTYGGEAKCYQRKIDLLRFDWKTYDPRTCQVRHKIYGVDFQWP